METAYEVNFYFGGTAYDDIALIAFCIYSADIARR